MLKVTPRGRAEGLRGHRQLVIDGMRWVEQRPLTDVVTRPWPRR
jgi:hypothetical protein